MAIPNTTTRMAPSTNSSRTYVGPFTEGEQCAPTASQARTHRDDGQRDQPCAVKPIRGILGCSAITRDRRDRGEVTKNRYTRLARMNDLSMATKWATIR